MTGQTSAPTNNIPPVSDARSNRNKTLKWLTFIFLLAALGWFLLWMFYLQYYQWTDDAYVNGNRINVTSVISGVPIAFFADDTDLVEEGQLLVLLDNTIQQISYEKELASLASIVLQVNQLYENMKAYTALVENKRTVVRRARYDYENRSRLVNSKAISNEEFSHSQDDLAMAEAALQQAESQLQIARDAAGNTPIEKHPLIEVQKSAIRHAFYNLKHCAIFAPMRGFIAQRKVEPGQWITPATYLMSVIPERKMWVDANFKETQLKHMRIGQPAEVTFDLYGSKIKFPGKVLGIASGTGSVFSLIPPQNATGNWIKIVQRLPVRIGIDSEKIKKHPLRLGISAEVSVDISNRELPLLAETPSTGAIAETPIFHLDLNSIEELMNKIISDNLSSTPYQVELQTS